MMMAAKKAPTKSTPARESAPKPRTSSTAKSMKTRATSEAVSSFLATLDEPTRAACEHIDSLMASATSSSGTMYGKSIVGYGTMTLRYADGREAPWMKMGFSPRKQALTLYGLVESAPKDLMDKLGKHTTGKGCLYIKKLEDVDGEVLKALIGLVAQSGAG